MVSLRVTVPVCSFRRGYAREYLETERMPPPATVYGFLLSLVGEEDRFRYAGTRIGCALLRGPQVSLVLRTAWRIKKKEHAPGTGSNKRPDYQEILTGLDLGIWVERGPLADELVKAARQPDSVDRFGGLSLGESRDLINDIQWFPDYGDQRMKWLIPQQEGPLTLPVWVDHVGSEGTVWQSFGLVEGSPQTIPSEASFWIRIAPREGSPQPPRGGSPKVDRRGRRRTLDGDS